MEPEAPAGTFIDEPIVRFMPRKPEDRLPARLIPVTLYETDRIYQSGRLITVNKLYMVYSIRNGMLRVINKFTARRGLLRGHSMQLTDIAFQSFESNVLASVNKDGAIIVWEVAEPSSEEPGALVCKKLVHLAQGFPETQYYKRLQWHPRNPDVLFTLSDKGQVDAWCVRDLKARFLEPTPEEDGADKGKEPPPPPPPPYLVDEPLPPGSHRLVRLPVMGDSPDLGVSFDGRILAACGEGGAKLELWDIPEDPTAEYLPLVQFTPLGAEDPVTSLHFLGSPHHPELVHYLITGSCCNRVIKVWSLQDVRQGSVRALQTVSFVPNPELPLPHWDEPPFLNVAHVDPSSRFLVVCNQQDPGAWVFHIADPALSPEGDLDIRLDYVTEFNVDKCVISFGLNIRDKAPPKDAPYAPAVSGIGLGLICIQSNAISLWQLEGIVPPAKRPRRSPQPEPTPGASPGPAYPPSLIAPAGELPNWEAADNGGPPPPEPPPSLLDPKPAAVPGSPADPREQRRQELMRLITVCHEPQIETPTTQPVAADEPRGPLAEDVARPAALAPGERPSVGVPPLPPPEGPSVAPSLAFPPLPRPLGDPAVSPFPLPSPPEVRFTGPIVGDPTDLMREALAQMHQMQQLSAHQWAQTQAALREQQEQHRRQMEELRAQMLAQSQKHDESAFNVAKEQRHHMTSFHQQLQAATHKQAQDLLRSLGERMKEHTEQLRPQLLTLQVQMENRQKQASEEMLQTVRKEFAQTKDQLQSLIKHQKDYNDLAKSRTKEAMESEQQRMHKLLETVSHTILNTVPDQLEDIQKKLLPALVSRVEGQVETATKDALEAACRKVLLPQIEAGVQRVLDRLGAAPSEALAPVVSRALTDQEPLLVRLVTEHVAAALPRALTAALEAQLQKVLPTVLQQTMADALNKMAASGVLPAAETPPPTMSEDAVKSEAAVLLQAKNYNQAFSKVLALQSIPAVEWLCEPLKPSEAFEGAHPLANPVILSLIHQLAFDLNSQAGMKLTWLQECVINLDPTHPVTKPHLPDVLGHVTGCLEKFLAVPEGPVEHKKTAKALLLMIKPMSGSSS